MNKFQRKYTKDNGSFLQRQNELSKVDMYIKENNIIITSSITCHHTRIYYSNGTCQCGGDVSGNVQCSTNPDKVSITSCSCMTFDDKEGLVVGRCLYGCGFYKTSGWSHNEYHPLPTNVSKLNMAMCGRLKRDFVVNIKKVSAPWFTLMI